jgi:hypothetical protein
MSEGTDTQNSTVAYWPTRVKPIRRYADCATEL